MNEDKVNTYVWLKMMSQNFRVAGFNVKNA